MKKLISVIFTAVILFEMIAMTVTSVGDTCIKLTDTTGSVGYAAGSDAVNAYAASNDGVTLIFDVLLESTSSPGDGNSSRLFAFTGDSKYNYAGYDFTKGEFAAGEGKSWPTVKHSDSFTAYSAKEFKWRQGQWYEIAYQFDGNVATVYLDGTPMVCAEIENTFDTKYIIIYPQYCNILIDNLRVCEKDYNVRDRVGEVIASTDFNGITSPGSVSCFAFAGTGYSVSDLGRSMPELGEITPERTVAPAVTGAYLKYTEADGIGLSLSGIDFTPYGGFTIVENIRVDRKSALGNFGVVFGENYMAGYDFDNNCFRIAQKSGYGFNSKEEYTFAKTNYTINLRETYEFAVRQTGSVVSVFLNGVLVLQASDAAFEAGFDKVGINNYRIGSSIDNLVIAYPDYDVREGVGGAAAKLTFDENTDNINSLWKFQLGSGNSGYSIGSESGGIVVSTSDSVSESGTADISISLSGCEGFNAFELRISYPSDLGVSSVSASGRLSGTSAFSKNTDNPLIMTYADSLGNKITDGEVMNITFTSPATPGDYTVTATLIPYFGDIPGAPVTGKGKVTVPEAGLPVGLPEGLSYDGTTLSWDPADTALAYEIYMLYEGDDYEYYIDYTEECQYSFPYEDYIPDAGVYIIRVYTYDDTYELASVSEDFPILVCDNGSVYGGVLSYANALYGKLVAFTEGKEYSASNMTTVENLLAEASAALSAASDFSSCDSVYGEYRQKLEDVPTGVDTVIRGDVDGNGKIDNTDMSILMRFVRGAKVTVSTGADVDSNGSINNVDISLLRTNLKTAG